MIVAFWIVDYHWDDMTTVTITYAKTNLEELVELVAKSEKRNSQR